MDASLLKGGVAAGSSIHAMPFQEHVELLRVFLAHREGIVEGIGALLKAERKPAGYLQDGSLLSSEFEDCLFERAGVSANQARLRGQLEQAYWDSGFRPRELPGMHNDLIDPAEMTVRAFHFWQQTGWPGRTGRTRYGHTLFNVYIVRCLELLSMRLWDTDTGDAGERLGQIQGVLDELWRGSPADQPVIVRDARWLIPLAQSLPTDELAAYLEAARLVRETLPESDALEIQKAHVRMLGGHLTSQIRHYCTRDGLSIDEPGLIVRTRVSNALDFALLIQGLVALLKAYDRAWLEGDERRRLDMAGAIFQGISADPALFLNRLDLLGAYSMIEDAFIATDDQGYVAYTPLGERHVKLLEEYSELINRLSRPLRDDVSRFRPVDGGYSSYGVVFGYPSTLTELMAFKALERDAETRFSLEDVFREDVDGRGNSAAKLAWVNGWRKLPHIPIEVQRAYDYPQQFAVEIYDRMVREITRRDSTAEAYDGAGTGRLYIASGEDAETGPNAQEIPEVPTHYFGTSDRELVLAHKAELYERAQLLHLRREGHFLVSYETPGGWMALKKELLEEVLGAGRDARIAGLPDAAAQVLQRMGMDLVRRQ